jgi:hypothetical protein
MMIDLRSQREGGADLSSSVPPLTGELQVLRSCNDTWLLDPSRKRYRRIPRNAPVSFLAEVGHWEPYERLELEEQSDDFTVVLNAAGSNRHRSFRHTLPCLQCGEGMSEDGHDGERDTSLFPD